MSPLRLQLRELREARLLTQDALAERAGLSRTTVSALEQGRSKGIDFNTLERLAAALEVNAGALIVGDSIGGSMHDRYTEHNIAMHGWFNQHGYLVRNERYDFDRNALIWDVGSATGPRRTLRITENVLSDVPAGTLGQRLDLRHVAQLLEKHESAIVKESGLDRKVVCEPFAA